MHDNGLRFLLEIGERREEANNADTLCDRPGVFVAPMVPGRRFVLLLSLLLLVLPEEDFLVLVLLIRLLLRRFLLPLLVVVVFVFFLHFRDPFAFIISQETYRHRNREKSTNFAGFLFVKGKSMEPGSRLPV